MKCTFNAVTPVNAKWIKSGLDEFPVCSRCASIAPDVFTALINTGAKVTQRDCLSATVEYNTGKPVTRVKIDDKIVSTGGVIQLVFYYSHQS